MSKEKWRELRREALRHIPISVFLRDQDKADFIDGKCTITEYQGTPILNYSKPWVDE